MISWRRMYVTLVFRNRSYNIRRQSLTRPASGVAGRGQSALVLIPVVGVGVGGGS